MDMFDPVSRQISHAGGYQVAKQLHVIICRLGVASAVPQVNLSRGAVLIRPTAVCKKLTKHAICPACFPYAPGAVICNVTPLKPKEIQQVNLVIC